MNHYQKAYECYREACQSFGMEWMNFSLFVRHLTKEQLDEYLKQSIN